MPPGHVSGAEAAAMAQQQPAVGTVVVQPQAQVVQPAAVTVVQPTAVQQPVQPVGQVVYQQQQPVQPVGQVVYQQQPQVVQPPAVMVQPPQQAGPVREKYVGIITISIAAVICCVFWPCVWVPFVAPCDERSVYPPQQQTSTVVMQQPAPAVVQPQQPGVVVQQQQPKYY